MDTERFDKQRRFILEIDAEKRIERQTHIAGMSRRENDAEHAWHMAIMTWLLSEYANEKIDLAKTMLMVLMHDVVEIDAGDAYAYDSQAKAAAHDRECAAADRIYSILPPDQARAARDLWEEFEEGATSEARFAHAMDNLQPVLLNLANEGDDWREHGVFRSQVDQRQAQTRLGSQELWEYVQSQLDRAVEAGWLKTGDLPGEGECS